MNKRMNHLQVFNFNARKVRTVVQGDLPWWVAKDVCDVLGLTNVSEAIRGLDADEKSTLRITEGGSAANIINEPGLYSLILRSRKPEAKTFKRWITHEVIPLLRKNGSYHITSQETVSKVLEIERAGRLIEILRDNANDLDADINRAILSRVSDLLKGEDLSRKTIEPVSTPTTDVKPVGFGTTEIAQMLGVSFQKVAGISKKYNLKTEKYGVWYEYIFGGKKEKIFIYNHTGKDTIIGFLKKASLIAEQGSDQLNPTI